ncbi:MAG: hypothetical protein IJE89_01645 [Bacilli bacterium]|nr:hypothetical protein [Bacilli bacterium]
MVFKSMKELKEWLDFCDCAYLSEGGQGRCYKIGNKVYKIFLQYIEEDDDEITPYYKDDILQFSDIVNNTYIFPTDVIMVGEIVVGYITDYAPSMSLYKTDPLTVDLSLFERSLEITLPDIKTISDNGVLSFDVTYNILYGKDGFKVIDTLDYSKTNIDSDKLFAMNKDRFYHEIRLFLIDEYFDKFVSRNKFLCEMYNDPDASAVLFLREFRKALSENEGHEISKLSEAKKSMVRIRRKIPRYIREL